MSNVKGERLKEILDYCLKNGDNKTLKTFDITSKTLARYRRKAKILFNKVGWRELSKVAKDHQIIKEKLNVSQIESSAKIPKADIVLLLGCMHFGSAGTDYVFLEWLTDFIKKNKIHFMMVGDDVDLFFNNFYSASPVQEQVLSPDEQLVFLESWLDEIGEYLICSCWGNHEERIEKLVGLKIYDRIKSRFAPYFGGIGKLNLQVGNIDYNVVLTHKAPGRSVFNPLHGLFNIARRITEGDLFIGAHYHNTALGEWEVRGKHCVAVQVGTLKKQDEFSERYFRFGNSNIIFPAVYFDDKTKNIIPFKNVCDAIYFRKKRA